MIIPLGALGIIGIGLYTLQWYFRLDPESRKKADRRANELAWDLFCKSLDRLEPNQVKKIVDKDETREPAIFCLIRSRESFT